MGVIERLTAEVASLKGALHTLRMTTPIAKNPTRVMPTQIARNSGRPGMIRQTVSPLRTPCANAQRA